MGCVNLSLTLNACASLTLNACAPQFAHTNKHVTIFICRIVVFAYERHWIKQTGYRFIERNAVFALIDRRFSRIEFIVRLTTVRTLCVRIATIRAIRSNIEQAHSTA
jgi:hypothetical protein